MKKYLVIYEYGGKYITFLKNLLTESVGSDWDNEPTRESVLQHW